MSGEVLIQVDNVSKKFCRDLKRSLWYGVQDIGADLLGRSNQDQELRPDEFWALKDVSFQLRRGECLGLIGRNGAGKSTLLKMLNGLIMPDRGRIAMYGRVGALIELGAGFNPILTGRENTYINGAVLGFSKEETMQKFDAIVDFSELEQFIDMPVRSYSSGMKVRLGFAIAVQMEPDILLIDEVLAVGDIGFKLKSFDVISKLMQHAAVILVSHSMKNIARVSTRIMLLNENQVQCDTDDIREGIASYHRLFQASKENILALDNCRVENLILNSKQFAKKTVDFKYLQPLSLGFEFFTEKNYEVRIQVSFLNPERTYVALYFSDVHSLVSGQNFVDVHIPQLPLVDGKYGLDIMVREELDNHIDRPIYMMENAGHILVSGAPFIANTHVQLVGKCTVGQENNRRITDKATTEGQ